MAGTCLSYHLLVLSWAGVVASWGGDMGEVLLGPMSGRRAGHFAVLRRASALGWH